MKNKISVTALIVVVVIAAIAYIEYSYKEHEEKDYYITDKEMIM